MQLPGRESRVTEEPFTQLAPMLEALSEAIKPYCEIPFAFFGHCMGALIAFELARRLNDRQQVLLQNLFVAGCRAPQLPRSEQAIHELPEPDFVAKLRELNQVPELVLQDEELLSLFMPVLRADFSVWDTYAYSDGKVLDCPISVFGGTQDRKLMLEALQPWRDQTRSAVTSRMLPGDHFFVHSSRSLLLRCITEDLRRTSPQSR